MKFSDKYNKTSFGIDTTGFTYCKLSDLYNDKQNGGADVIRRLNGCWVTKSALGFSPVLIVAAEKKLVNLPQHKTEIINSILADMDAVNDIKEGKVGFVIYEYFSHGKKCYSINFVDL